MTITINKQNFSIPSGRVPLLLNDLKTTYPEITGLDYEFDSHNLQLLLAKLGWHIRSHPDKFMFAIRPINTKAEDNILDLFNILSKYMDDNAIIVVTINDNTYTFTNNGCVNVIGEQNKEEISSENENTFIDEDIEETLIEEVINVTESDILAPIVEQKNEKIKSKSVIDSKVVKKKGGRPRKEIKK